MTIKFDKPNSSELNKETTLSTSGETNTKFAEIIIVGAGFSGICAAIQLLEAGFTDFILLEKADQVGGVWHHNTYPGCACDVPSSLYSYSFAPNPSWSRVFAEQAEIKQYLKNTARKKNIYKHILFKHELLSSEWNEENQQWQVKTNKGTFHARFTIMAAGPMHQPAIPELKGLETFNGSYFHSAQWNHHCDLTNKRVAVIGSGASAIQLVPQIQTKVKELSVFQRTAHWILPKQDPQIPNSIRRVFKYVPFAQKLMRASVYLSFEILNSGVRLPLLMNLLEKIALSNIHRTIKDPTLRAQLTPDYKIGCKRILQSSDWYPSLVKPNVNVITDSVESIEGNYLISSQGIRKEVDIIIFATGFEMGITPIAKKIRGMSGNLLFDHTKGSPASYHGTMVEDCPNAFFLIGPNLAVASSAIIIIEAQVNYILNALKKIKANQITSIRTNPDITTTYNQKVQGALQKTVWNNGGCTSYFLDANGRNNLAWPWTTFKMRLQFLRFNLANFISSSKTQR